MKYLKDPVSGAVFAYEADGSQDEIIPENLIPMTDIEVHQHLNPPAPELTREQVEQLRLRAYGHSVTGSDRYFAEAVRLQAMGAGDDEIEAARQAGLQRYNEIQAQYPWPDQ